MYWKYIVKLYKTKLISQARRQEGNAQNLRSIKQRKGRLSISLNHSISQSYRNVTFFTRKSILQMKRTVI